MARFCSDTSVSKTPCRSGNKFILEFRPDNPDKPSIKPTTQSPPPPPHSGEVVKNLEIFLDFTLCRCNNSNNCNNQRGEHTLAQATPDFRVDDQRIRIFISLLILILSLVQPLT